MWDTCHNQVIPVTQRYFKFDQVMNLFTSLQAPNLDIKMTRILIWYVKVLEEPLQEPQLQHHTHWVRLSACQPRSAFTDGFSSCIDKSCKLWIHYKKNYLIFHFFQYKMIYAAFVHLLKITQSYYNIYF